MPEYRYELRRGDEVIATGHLSSEQPFEVGERITIGSQAGIVRPALLLAPRPLEGRRIVGLLHPITFRRSCGRALSRKRD